MRLKDISFAFIVFFELVAAAAAAAAATEVVAADILWQVAEQLEIPGKEGLDFFEFTLDSLFRGRNGGPTNFLFHGACWKTKRFRVEFFALLFFCHPLYTAPPTRSHAIIRPKKISSGIIAFVSKASVTRMIAT